MKLLLVTAIRECQKAVDTIFDSNGIKKYSLTDIYGIGNNSKPDHTGNWFGRSVANENLFDSVMLFCFTEDAVAQKTLADLKTYNETQKPVFPLRALILPVEESI